MSRVIKNPSESLFLLYSILTIKSNIINHLTNKGQERRPKKMKTNPKRSLFLRGNNNDNDYDKLVLELFELNKMKGKIWLWINSSGGSSVGARKLYDNIINSPNPVYGIIAGDCFSSASIVLQACKKRYATKNSRFHIHNAVWPLNILVKHNSNFNDFENEVKDAIKLVQEANNTAEKIFLQKTNIKLNRIKKIMTKNKIIPLKEALKMGFIDEII